MPYPYDANDLAALNRLAVVYNGSDYDAGSNPGGMGHGGHRVNFIPSLQDHARVANAVGAAADSANISANAASNYATALSGTSTTSLTIGTGSKTLTTQSGKTFTVGAHVLISNTATPTNYMHGQITAYTGTSLTVDVTLTSGSGTFNSWNVNLSAPRGPTGSTGSTGAPGLAGLRFKWSTNTANTDPTSGYIKINNASPASATALYISETDQNAASVSALLALWDDSTGTTKGLLQIVDSADLTKFLTFVVTGTMTDNGAWDTFTISGGSGTTPNNDDIVAVQFIPYGNQGNMGATGARGDAGGGFTLTYLFSTTTTDSDPGNGFLRFDSGTQNVTTTVRIDLLESNSVDVTALLNTIDDSTTTASRGYLRIYKTADPTAYIIFNVTALATPSGYRNVTVSVLAASATNPFANNDPVTITFDRTGDAGGGSASGISFTPAGNIAATNVQTAIEELDTEKVSSNNSVLTGTTNVSQAIKVAGDITPSALTASVNDYNPSGLTTASVIRLSVSSSVSWNITGLQGGDDGRILYLYHAGGTGKIALLHESASSSAANRFSFGGDITLHPNSGLMIIYDSTASRWKPMFPYGNAIAVDANGQLKVNANTATTSTSTGALVVVGGVGIGLGATVGGLIDASGGSAGQIKFPATQNASSNVNTLDDYEEGSWTPVLIHNIDNGTIGYTTQTGRYVKIGKLVNFSFTMICSAISGASGVSQVAGLPFANGDVAAAITMGFFGGLLESVCAMSGYLETGDTEIILYVVTNTADTSNQPLTAGLYLNGSTTFQIYMSGAYIAAA